MKHVPLKRKKPMARGKPIKRRRNAAGKPRERFEKLRDEAYRAWIREQPCQVLLCPRPTQATHVWSKATGTGDRNNLVSLCAFHHAIQHNVGIRTFAHVYECDLAAIAKELDARYEKECGR